MALSDNINTREFEKFTEADQPVIGTVVKVLAKIAAGEITILSPDDFLITTFDVGDTPVKLPATAATGRIALDVRNLANPANPADSAKILYVGPTSAVTATDPGGTTTAFGWTIGPGEGDNGSLRAIKEPWAVAPTGVTVRVQVREWILIP